MEAKAAPIIPLALEAFEAVSKDDALALIDCLKQIADHIHGLSLVLPRMYERNDPQFFYNRIRPLLAGCKASAELPNGVFYENEYGGGSWREYTGPNATQSSLWQFIDLALGVKHLPTGTTSSNYGNVVESTTKLGKHQIFQEVDGSRYTNAYNCLLNWRAGNATIHARSTPPLPRKSRRRSQCQNLHHRSS